MKKLSKIFYIIPVLLLVGCMNKQINTINSVVYGQSVTEAKVEQSIIKSAKKLGWMTKKVGANTIEAKLMIRTHEVVVIIPYNSSKYAITYKDSKNMDYDAERGIINHNYNKWIRNLDLEIQKELNK